MYPQSCTNHILQNYNEVFPSTYKETYFITAWYVNLRKIFSLSCYDLKQGSGCEGHITDPES